MIKKILLVFFLFLNGLLVKSQVFINEYSCSNISTITDNFNEYEDWVELYNAGAAPVNLLGYFLSDNPNKPSKWTFPAMSIAAGGKVLVFCSGRSGIAGTNVHANFKLTQTKPESIVFSNNLGVLLESIELVPTQKNHSRGRTTDGSALWSLFTTPTPNASNANPKTDYSAKPVLDKAPGFYPSSISVTITTSDPSASIFYTVNGTVPTAASTAYTGPVVINSTTVLRVIGVSSNINTPASFTETNTYFINSTHTLPVISVAGNNLNLLFGGNQALREGSFEYFDVTGLFKTETDGEFNKHGNDSWAYPQRGVDFISRDQHGYNHSIKEKLFANKSRDEFQRVIIKPAASDNYPFETGGAHIRDAYVHSLSQKGKLNLDERTSSFCILYMNGAYWGVYDLREKVDDSDFTSFYNNQDVPYKDSPKDVQFLKTWGSTWADYGGGQATADWNAFRTFVSSNNMAIQANYDSVERVYNTKSLVDYFVLNSYIVNRDWLNWNTAWWRGLNPSGDKKKWRYVLWDMDATFGHYNNFTNIPNTSATAGPCDPEALPNPGGQGHTQILNALMANEGFKQFYISRFIDLSNTVFQCSYMINMLDSMVGVISPEMPGQIAKWGGNMNTWQNNVQSMKNFINDRCAALSTGLNDCYTLSGPYNIVYDVSPANAGNIKINSIIPSTYTFAGDYYGGIDILLNAISAPGYEFDYWQLQNHTLSPSNNDSSTVLNITQADSIVAVFKLVEITEPVPVPTPTPTPTPDPDPDPNDTTIVVPPGGVGAGVFIPNAFSPNGDGTNDVLFLFGNKVASIEFSVFNRWGQKVFETTSLSTGWDGTFNGQLLNPGVYAYQIQVKFINGDEENKRGNITLFK
ncbi:MAG: CotH kinase family protein [Bacteroidetes bacterium]|nr:CotH kinase family protein [Bacteroidota bacterium]HET6245489.1 CotH kinase family protein [Bacteroidia bacterium]